MKKAFFYAAPFAMALSSPALAEDETPAQSEASFQHAILVLPVPTPAPAPPISAYRDTYESVAGKSYFVSARLHQLFDEAKLPKGALIATCARESSCNPRAENPSSKACGLFQLMTDVRTATLYEAVYNYGAQYGYEREAAMVRREHQGYFKDGQPKYGYFPITPAAKRHLVEKCFDAKFSVDMHEGYTMPKVLAFRQQFGRDMTYGDLAGMNNWGDKGWKMIVEQVEENSRNGRTTMASTFFNRHKNVFGDVSANRSMFYSGGRALSIGEAYRNLVRHGGETVIEIPREPPVILAEVEPLVTTHVNFNMPLIKLPKLRR